LFLFFQVKAPSMRPYLLHLSSLFSPNHLHLSTIHFFHPPLSSPLLCCDERSPLAS
ncbi:hypothetical protein GBA52_004539, partial [Prunus armeniaca]